MSEVFTTMDNKRARSAAARRAYRRKRRIRSAVALFITCVVVVAATVVALPYVKSAIDSRSITDYEGPGSGEVLVEIPQGATGSAMAEILAKADVVASPAAFVQAFTSDPRSGSIQPGAYRLKMKMSGQGAVSALLDPASKAEVTITIPEGFAKAQIAERVANVMEVPLADVSAILDDPQALGLPEQANGNAEGWLAPATYTIQPDSTVKDVLSSMVAKRIEGLEKINLPKDRWQRTLIVGSIVEREVNWPDHYGKVARVIENRLTNTDQVGGKLQMDSTTMYGVGKFGGIPTEAELQNDNPYNTYLHAGLPPYPISNPSLEVIEATANPPAGDWLFFVTVNLDTGETLFSSNLDDHSKNVEILRQWYAENEKNK
ncbi:endolytic transglycosylase MltG [Arcanobacterium pinnipediorum]|uniref:Endolytic murein transglycosylase n=1 Tax=Arcanobacterium pinnipediorum TaxID=1503041 RepID=A0ABY5AIY8_9ACTO|nr:endolytic transglycosylase MltG [Arcanobacterium pinnipediorum]USR80184.1 endolytic transglycosylase MltG [Arcanobacterium pinnipediorum]